MPLPRKIPVDIANPNTWLTRAEVAELLKCSSMTIKRWDNRRLHPFVDAKGVHRYNPIEVRGLEVRDARKGKHRVPSQGELEAAVVDLIVQGKSKLDIVRQLAMPIDDVQRIWEKAQESFTDAAEAKRKTEMRARFEARKREEADRKLRERIARMKVEKATILADAETAKELRRALRAMGIKTPKRKSDRESPDQTETAAEPGADGE